MKAIDSFIHERLNQRQSIGTSRQLSMNDALIDFSSNDYLGFARSAELKICFESALKKYPDYKLGSTGSRLLAGNDWFTENLEKQIAAFHLAESALIFNSGYDANLGLLSSLPQRGDTIITDELVHASIIDGARLSHAHRYTFKHNDLNSLEQKLKRAQGTTMSDRSQTTVKNFAHGSFMADRKTNYTREKIYIAVEIIYSMDGDEAPLKEICNLAEQYHAALLVDEAHATGVFGTQGRGLVEKEGLTNRVFARTITFGKALGTHGAAILGSNVLRSYLINFARSFIYSTAASFCSHLATEAAYQFLIQHDHQLAINQRIHYFKEAIYATSRLIESRSPIQILLIPGNREAKNAEQGLQHAGFDVRAVLSPTVKAGSERLRICLHNHNSFEEIKNLASTINQYL